MLRYSGSDTILLQDWFNGNRPGSVEVYTESNDTPDYSLTAEELENLNHEPGLADPLEDRSAVENSLFTFQVPASTFTDPDSDDSLTFSASMADGSSLPAWLAFDAETQIFSGVPDSEAAGTLDIRVTATDTKGQTAEDVFLLTVEDSIEQTGSEGNDTIQGSESNDTLYGQDGNDRLYGRDGDDALNGGSGNDYLHGGTGSDILNGGDGVDAADYSDSTEGVTVSLADNLAQGGTAEGDTFISIEKLYGSNHDDTLTGNGENNTLLGRDGNDTLTGNAGNDYLRGGEGADLLDGGDGIDAADYSDSTEGVTVSLADNLAQGGTAEGDTFISIEKLYGSNHDDTLTGNGENNTLLGRDGNDTLTGNAGNDYLRGGEGADLLDGGDGIDAADYSDSTEGVTVSLADNLAQGGTAEGDTFISIEKLYGSNHDDTLAGNDENNTLLGRDGNDTLTGNAGNDYLRGGEGADLLDGGDGIDAADYSDSTEGVTVSLADNLAQGGTAEGDTFISIEKLYGSNHDDTLTGNGENNTLLGRDGNDTLTGNAGNDYLRGGEGADLLDGGDGIDAADYSDSTEGVTVSLADNLAQGGTAEGDTFISIEKLYGSNHDDTLAGNDENNTLLGRDGNDTLTGNAGNDYLRGGEGADLLDGGDGIDAADYSDSTEGVTVSLADNLAQGGTAEGDTFISIEKLYGSNHDDTLAGNDENNTLLGRDGNDTLTGNAGNDYLRGGEGADLLDGGDGIDAADYSDSTEGVTVSLADNLAQGGTAEGDTFISIEKLYGSNHDDTLTGNDENNTLLGRDGNDTLTGNAGNDWIKGGLGNDIIAGGQGNDRMFGEQGDDIYLLSDGFGVDTVEDAAGDDTILFDSTISKDRIAIYKNGDDFVIGCDESDLLTVTSGVAGSVEQYELSDGSYLTATDINQVIQDMTAFAADNGIAINSVQDIRQNQDLMNMVISAWHAA